MKEGTVRVWDQKNEQMYDLGTLSRKTYTISDLNEKDHIRIMMGTGVKDSKSNVIFGGDILKIEGEAIDGLFLVTYDKGAYLVRNVLNKEDNWLLNRGVEKIRYREVKGNKYENPELMEKFALLIDGTMNGDLLSTSKDSPVEVEVGKVEPLDRNGEYFGALETPILIGKATGEMHQGEASIKDFLEV